MEMALGDESGMELSASTAALLMEFMNEKHQNLAKNNFNDGFDMGNFDEDWQLSQFWYTSETAKILATEAHCDGTVGFISSPSAYVAYKQLYGGENGGDSYLFEFDLRFGRFKDFEYYDYNNPDTIRQDLKGKFNCLVIDPPFLSEECFGKTMQTVKLLGRKDCKYIICTGQVMEGLAKTLANANLVKFQPRHEKGLSNDFSCFINYDSNDEFFKPSK